MNDDDSYTPAMRDYLEQEAQECERAEREQAEQESWLRHEEKEARTDAIIGDCLQNLIHDRDEVFEAVGCGYESLPEWPAMPSPIFRLAACTTKDGRQSMDDMSKAVTSARDAMADDLALHIGHALLTGNHAELGRLVASYAKPYLLKTAKRLAEDL